MHTDAQNPTNRRDVTEIVDAVLRASRVLVAVAARSLVGVDREVTVPQFRALVVLASRGALTSCCICRRARRAYFDGDSNV